MTSTHFGDLLKRLRDLRTARLRSLEADEGEHSPASLDRLGNEAADRIEQLEAAGDRALRAIKALTRNIAEFDTITDGELLDDLDKAEELLCAALKKAEGE